MAKRDRQPAAISPDLIIGSRDYRASMHMELQKFGHRDRARQLLLSEIIPADETELEAKVQETGLDLSVSELRAIDALQLLLEETDYQGNEPGGEIIRSEAFKYEGLVPKLRVTFSEYLEAYGLQRSSSGFSRAQRDEAMQALDSLTEPRTVAYSRRYRQGKRYKNDVVIARRPLISVSKGYKGLTDQQAEEVIVTEGKSRRPTHLLIDFSPLWVDQIASFYVLKPVGFYDELRLAIGSKRPSASIQLFLNWLMTKNKAIVKIGREKLAERIRLAHLLDSRHQSRLDKQLQEAIDVALEMGYLLSYEQDALQMYTFYLNPERCKRVKPGAEPETEED